MSSPTHHLDMLARLASVCGEWNGKLVEMADTLDGPLAVAVAKAADLLSDVDEVLSVAYCAERKKFPPSTVRALPVSRVTERHACAVLGRDTTDPFTPLPDARHTLRRRADGFYRVEWQEGGKRHGKLFGSNEAEAKRRHAEWLAGLEMETESIEIINGFEAPPAAPGLFDLVLAGEGGGGR